MDKIPSELIEPHIMRFLISNLQDLYYGVQTPEQVRETLRGVESFVVFSCGLHANIATGNEFNKIYRMSDERMREVANGIFANKTLNS